MSLSVGLRVKALFDDAIHWYPAVIVQENTNGTFGLRYDDGDTRDDVQPQDIISDDVPMVETRPNNELELETLKSEIISLQKDMKEKEIKIQNLEEQMLSSTKTHQVAEIKLSESVEAGLIALKRAETAEAKIKELETTIKYLEIKAKQEDVKPFDVSEFIEVSDLGNLIIEIAHSKKTTTIGASGLKVEVDPSDLKIASLAVETAGDAWNFLRRRCEALMNSLVNEQPLPAEFEFTKPFDKTMSSTNLNSNINNKSNNSKPNREISSIGRIGGLNNKTWQKPDTPAHTQSQPAKVSLRTRRTVEPTEPTPPSSKPTNGYASDDTPKSESSPLTINDSPLTSPIPTIITDVSPTTEYTFNSPSTSNKPPSKLWGITSVLGSNQTNSSETTPNNQSSEPRASGVVKQEPKRAPSPVAERVRQWKQTSNTPAQTEETEPRDSSKGRSQRRIASPFIARKLASWKGSDKEEATSSTTTSTSVDKEPITSSTPSSPPSSSSTTGRTNSWLQNQNNQQESRPRNSPSPARRYSSPVSERVKQWRAAANRNQNTSAPPSNPSSNATTSSSSSSSSSTTTALPKSTVTPLTASPPSVSSTPDVTNEPAKTDTLETKNITQNPETEVTVSIPPEPTSSSRKTDVVADSKVSNNKKTGGDKKVVSDEKVSEFKKGKEPKETVPANNDEVSQSKSEIPHKVESKPESMTSSAVPSSSPPLKELTLGLGGGPTGNGLEAGVQFMIPESLAVGAKVDALFDDNIHFYSAVVNAVEANGQVHLRFDDGDEREHVPLSEVRIKDPNNATMHIDVDTEEETNSIDKLQAMLGDLVPSKDTIINPTPPPTTEPMVVQKKLEKEKSIPHSPKDPRLNRFSSSRGSGTPPRRASPLRGLLEKDSSRAAGQAKKQLSQLEQMREEVARIRLMNERDMPAITEPSHEEEAPSPVSSPTQIPSTTLQLASTRLELVVEEQKDDNKKGSNMPETPVVSQRLRAWQDRHGNEPAAPRPGSLSGSLSSSLSVAPRSSSAGNTATTTGTARTLFVGGGDRGSNSTGRVLGGNSGNGDSNIRTITRSSIQATSAPSRISAITPPPRSNSRGPSESSDKDEGGKAKLRNMSPLIAQRMAAFHKSR